MSTTPDQFRARSGSELAALYDDSFVSALTLAISPSGPEYAHSRIIKHFKVRRNFLPSRIPLFTRISKAVRARDGDLLILAPHTHWEISSPIIYTYRTKGNKYFVGCLEIDPNGVYQPVSFVMHYGSVLPYEWIDQSITIDQCELQKNVDIINFLFDTGLVGEEPIGIGIDFRFRHKEATPIADQYNTGSIEFPVTINGNASKKYSQIMSDVDFEELPLTYRDNLNVGWPCRVDEDLMLGSGAVFALNRLRNAIVEIEDIEERVAFMKKLEEAAGL